MQPDFDTNRYWLERGKSYSREERLSSKYYRLQERFILDALSMKSLAVSTILEIGCGFGRVTRVLARAFPESQITAIDLSPDQLDRARIYCSGCTNITFQQYDIYSTLPLPGDRYALSTAIEVFLHHPAEVVISFVKKLLSVSTYLLHVDWSEEWSWDVADHVCVHDYEAMYRSSGLACTSLILPQKIEGLQQKLFIVSERRRDQGE